MSEIVITPCVYEQINELGRKLLGDRLIDDEYTAEPYHRSRYRGVTLGAHRRSKYMLCMPGSVIPMWMPCAAQDQVTGVPWPHAFFISDSTSGGSIHCPPCRERLQRKHSGVAPRGSTPTPDVTRTSTTPDLPF